jgi:SAM-dependent methyltransferase
LLFLPQLSDLETLIYNNGERLIPNVTHARDELVRHKSSYLFFYRIIKYDLNQKRNSNKVIRIVDLGCGVGHGCHMLSQLPNSEVVGVDISQPTLEYAGIHYSSPNINYQLANLEDYVLSMPEFDYVVSCGAFEHIDNGINLTLSSNWTSRLILDVPYNEPEGRNPHHMISNINEECFADFPEAEIFYQDLGGVVYDINKKPPGANMIICVCSHPDLPRISDTILNFPLAAWTEDLRLEGI